jgi:hypothetical protein
MWARFNAKILRENMRFLMYFEVKADAINKVISSEDLYEST